MTTALYFATGLGLSLALTPACRAAARRFGMTATPREDRWHQRPTALLGGVAIAMPTLLIGATLPLADVWPLLVCGGLIAAFGFVDDVLTLRPATKLIVQIVVASVLVFVGYRLHWTPSMTGDLLLTLLWIVGITNAFNLLDNMDGLCAGTALVAGGFTLFTINTHAGAATSEALYLAGLLGATAGFLVYNVNPASIFMGDTGSLFLGLNLAVAALISGSLDRGQGPSIGTVAPVLLLLLPILDTTLVTALRILSGRKPSQGGRDHTSHRLVAIGLSPRTAVLVLWLVAAIGGAAAVALRMTSSNVAAMSAALLLLCAIVFAVYLASVRVYEGEHLVRLREGSVTPVVVDFMQRRRIAEVLLDLCLITLAYYASYHLVFDAAPLSSNFQLFLQSLPLVVAAQLIALFIAGGYRGTWHWFGMSDAVVFVKAVALGAVSTQIILLYLYRFESYSRAVFVIYAVLLLGLLCASRASFRLMSEFVDQRRATGDRCVIYGTGSASLATVREAFGDRPMRVVGFIDDDPRQRRLRLAGYTVLGDFDTLVTMIRKREVDAVILNTRIIDVDRLRFLEQTCGEEQVQLLRLHINVQPFSAVS